MFPKLKIQSDNLGTGMYSTISEVTGNVKLRGIVSILEGEVATQVALNSLN